MTFGSRNPGSPGGGGSGGAGGAGGAGEAGAAGVPSDIVCHPLLPDPELFVNSWVVEEYIDGGGVTVLDVSVLNWQEYPPDLFFRSDVIGPCGLNPRPARTWVDFQDRFGEFLTGFCGVLGPDALARMLFQFPGMPDGVQVRLDDRVCDIQYTSEVIRRERSP